MILRLALFAALALPLVARAELPKPLDSEGRPVSLAEKKGVRHRVVVFAGLGLPSETAMLDTLQANLKPLRKRRDSSLTVVFVGMTPRQAGEYVRGRDWRFPWVCDPAGALLAPLGVDFLPTLMLLGSGDRIVFRSTALSDSLVKGLLKHPERPPVQAR